MQIPSQHQLREHRIRRTVHRRHNATPGRSQPPTTKDPQPLEPQRTGHTVATQLPTAQENAINHSQAETHQTSLPHQPTAPPKPAGHRPELVSKIIPSGFLGLCGPDPEKIFTDTASGKNAARPELDKALAYLRAPATSSSSPGCPAPGGTSSG